MSKGHKSHPERTSSAKAGILWSTKPVMTVVDYNTHNKINTYKSMLIYVNNWINKWDKRDSCPFQKNFNKYRENEENRKSPIEYRILTVASKIHC